MHTTLTRIDPDLLRQELAAAGIDVPGVGYSPTPEQGGGEVYTYDASGSPIDLPPEARPVVDAHTAPPLVIEYAGQQQVDAIVRTTDATALEVFRFPCESKHFYQASLTITGTDAGNGAVKIMEGRFAWKRLLAGALVSGLTVVSDIHDAAAASWAPNFHIDGNDVVFTVQGAAGRTIDWLLAGSVGRYAPAGLTT